MYLHVQLSGGERSVFYVLAYILLVYASSEGYDKTAGCTVSSEPWPFADVKSDIVHVIRSKMS